MFILDDLLVLPAKGLFGLLEIITKQAEQELRDEDTIKKMLKELHFAYDIGEVSEAEYEKRQAKLLDRLKLAQELKLQDLEELEEEQDERFLSYEVTTGLK